MHPALLRGSRVPPPPTNAKTANLPGPDYIKESPRRAEPSLRPPRSARGVSKGGKGLARGRAGRLFSLLAEFPHPAAVEGPPRGAGLEVWGGVFRGTLGRTPIPSASPLDARVREMSPSEEKGRLNARGFFFGGGEGIFFILILFLNFFSSPLSKSPISSPPPQTVQRGPLGRRQG